MTDLVLDVSVAVKWALPTADEQLKLEAFQLLERYSTKEIDFLVPDVFWAETGNVLWKAARQGRHSRTAAEDAMSAMLDRDFPTISSLDLLPDALDIALSSGCAVYDSLYVALALHTRTQFVTADERLVNALAARFPVKWLGTI